MFALALGIATLSQAVSAAETSRVVVVANIASPVSLEVAEYYRQRRGLKPGQVIKVDVSTGENVSDNEYQTYVEEPVRQALRRMGRVDYIVLTKGIPHKIGDDDPNSTMDGLALDAQLAAMDVAAPQLLDPRQVEQAQAAANPYFNQSKPFDSTQTPLKLVTRLDGYSVADCKALVDHSLAAEATKGPVLLDGDDNKDGPGYADVQALMQAVVPDLRRLGVSAEFENSRAFVRPRGPLMAYVSWGSNDSTFDASIYRSIRFLPGAVADTFVSTDGRTFLPVTGGQSLVADLIHQGVTGVKAYVSEPYASGLTRPDILLEHYFSGYNLAESFYAATPFLKWKDVVIGDPLCRPFGRRS